MNRLSLPQIASWLLLVPFGLLASYGTALAEDPLGTAFDNGSSFNAIPIKCSKGAVTDTGSPIVEDSIGGPAHHETGPGPFSLGGTSGMISFSNNVELDIHSPNRVWSLVKIGDPVQVCLIALPARTATCNPQIDARGRRYYVYDYRTQGAFIETTGAHACGGA